MLSAVERQRYQKQILLAELGEEGQALLKQSAVLVIGAGGVGSPCAQYLAGAGVGTIGIADGDSVALSNLHRQLLYRTADVGRPKTVAAKEDLTALNPEIRVETYASYLTFAAVKKLARQYDMIIDAADGLETKLMIADACAAVRKPHCHAMIGQFRAQVLTCVPELGNCFRCLFAAGAQYQSARTGTWNAVCGVAGCVQASETMKYILKTGALLSNRLLYVDLLENCFQTVSCCRQGHCDQI